MLAYIADEGEEFVPDEPEPSAAPEVSEREESNTDMWKLRCVSLQAQVTEYQEKLRKKQDSFVQVNY